MVTLFVSGNPPTLPLDNLCQDSPLSSNAKDLDVLYITKDLVELDLNMSSIAEDLIELHIGKMVGTHTNPPRR